jgi:hypothetical protein
MDKCCQEKRWDGQKKLVKKTCDVNICEHTYAYIAFEFDVLRLPVTKIPIETAFSNGNLKSIIRVIFYVIANK